MNSPTDSSPASPSPAGVQALIVLTDPTCVYAIDVVDEGVSDDGAVASRVAGRLGIAVEHAAEVLDGLVGVGFVDRTGLGTVGPRGEAPYREHVLDALEQIAWLRDCGDHRQADDLVAAMDAAYNTRSTDPGARWRAALFRSSTAGRRHAKRLADRTLGEPAELDVWSRGLGASA